MWVKSNRWFWMWFFTGMVVLGCGEEDSPKKVSAAKKEMPWSALPQVHQPSDKNFFVKNLVTSKNFVFTTADILTFAAQPEVKTLEVKTNCHNTQGERDFHQWEGPLENHTVKILSLLPRRLLYHQGQMGPQNSFCEFSFIARNQRGDIHRFELPSIAIKSHSQENTLFVHENQIRGFAKVSPMTSLILDCENFSLPLAELKSDSISLDDLVNDLKKISEVRSAILQRPRQICRLFQLHHQNVVAVSKVLDLQFGPPALEFHYQAFPFKESFLEEGQQRLQLGRIRVHNPHPYRYYLRLNHSSSRGVLINAHYIEGNTSTAQATFPVGYTFSINHPYAQLLSNGTWVVELPPYGHFDVTLQTSLRWYCQHARGIYVANDPHHKIVFEGLRESDDFHQKAKADWTLPLPTFKQWWSIMKFGGKSTTPPVRVARKRKLNCEVTPL